MTRRKRLNGYVGSTEAMRKKEGLSRIEPSADKRGGGWRILIARQGRSFGTKFADSMYASPAIARKAAEAFLHELQKMLPPAKIFQRLGSDGLPGSVKLVEEKTQYWRGMLRINGKSLRKTYGTAKYGYEEARQLALATRERWLREAGFYRQIELPSDEEVDQISQRIRRQFDERRKARPRGEFHEVEDYGLIRREPSMHGKGGYWVVSLTRSGVHYRRRFGDSVHGGSDLARRAALQYRDDILASKEAMSKRERQQLLTKRNTTGAVGVYAQRKNGVLLGWAAQADVRGKVHTRYFHATKYGPEKAFELAVQARKQMLEMVEGDCTVSPAGRRLSERFQSKRNTMQRGTKCT